MAHSVHELVKRFGSGAKVTTPETGHCQRWSAVRGSNESQAYWQCGHCQAFLMRCSRRPADAGMMCYYDLPPCLKGAETMISAERWKPNPVCRPQTSTGLETPPYPWPQASMDLHGLVTAGLAAGDRNIGFKKPKGHKTKFNWDAEATTAAQPAAATPSGSSNRRRVSPGAQPQPAGTGGNSASRTPSQRRIQELEAQVANLQAAPTTPLSAAAPVFPSPCAAAPIFGTGNIMADSGWTAPAAWQIPVPQEATVPDETGWVSPGASPRARRK